MAGHSQFKNIMHRKGAQDARRAKVFTKLIRELTVSAKISADPEANSRLRSAIFAARDANMPKETIDRAIKRGAGGEEGIDYQEITYEGYGPGGVAVIVEALTDNRNRTAADVRSTFSKFGGNLGETNSVNFQFDRCGFLMFPLTIGTEEEVLEAALNAGATDLVLTEDGYEIFCAMTDLNEVRSQLKFGDPQQAKLIWRPKNFIAASPESLIKLIDTLEDNDDVQAVYLNAVF